MRRGHSKAKAGMTEKGDRYLGLGLGLSWRKCPAKTLRPSKRARPAPHSSEAAWKRYRQKYGSTFGFEYHAHDGTYTHRNNKLQCVISSVAHSVLKHLRVEKVFF